MSSLFTLITRCVGSSRTIEWMYGFMVIILALIFIVTTIGSSRALEEGDIHIGEFALIGLLACSLYILGLILFYLVRIAHRLNDIAMVEGSR